jgi:uncharacterized protein YfiM (DUF2279 family)
VKLKAVLFLLCFCALSPFTFAQLKDTLSHKINKNRFIPVGLAAGISWVGSTAALSHIWYSDFKKTSFHTFNDGQDWMQMDKAGHVFTAFHLSEASYRSFQWTGLSEKSSKWIGAGIGLGFQTSLEILDGKNAGWGFSWYDMAANALGSAWFLAQQSLWSEQRFLLKFSYHPTEFAKYRPNVLGSTFVESFLKDYNGQTYWLSFSPKHFNENWILPSWLCFSFGYSVEEKLVGDKDFFVKDQMNFKAKRQYLFSLDLDVRALRIKKKWVKAILRPLHYIKVPFPSLILDGNKLKGNWLYF